MLVCRLKYVKNARHSLSPFLDRQEGFAVFLGDETHLGFLYFSIEKKEEEKRKTVDPKEDKVIPPILRVGLSY